MSAVYSKNLQVFNAKQFQESVSEPSSSNVYFTIGRITPWANDSNPPQANTSVVSFNEVWKNMVGGKRVTGNDVRHCVPRINWTPGTVYTPYDCYEDSLGLNYNGNGFYILTSNYDVYKCIDNNQDAESTEEPTIVSVSGTTTTSDGYIWKYMYTISPADRLRYLTSEFMPVVESESVKLGAVKGEIAAIRINNPGVYPANDVTVTITGDGTGAQAWANVNTVSQSIESISIISPGVNYTYANVELVSANIYSNTANVTALISPFGGHGYDTLGELGASWVMINTRLKGSESGKLMTTNEYRQIALIDEPYIYGSSNVAANTVFSQLTKFTMSGISVDFIPDEIVYQGPSLEFATFKAVVAGWDSANSVLTITNIDGEPINDSLNGVTSTARKFISSISLPDLEPFSGRLLYMDNIQPIERAEDQTDSFQIVLKF